VPTPLKRLILFAAFAIGTGVSFPAIAAAQPHGHPGGGHGHGAVVVAPYYPYYPFGVGFGWGYGYGPWWPSPYPYYPYGYPSDPDGSLKLEVKPRTAEVYVDGYYAGVVDNFDGTFQRLHTSPGEHEFTLYQEGFRTVHQKLYVQPNVTTKLKYQMEQLTAGEQPEARPQPPNPPPDQGQQMQPRGPYPPPRGQQPPYQQGPPYQGPPPQGPPPQGQPRQGSVPPNQQVGVNVYGTIAVRVQPGGADIVVDGERWNGPEGQERVFIEVPEGRHTVEIHKQGFRGYVTEIDVRPGETASLNVSLRSQEDQ